VLYKDYALGWAHLKIAYGRTCERTSSSSLNTALSPVKYGAAWDSGGAHQTLAHLI